MGRGLDVIGVDPTGLFSFLSQTGSGVVDYVKKDQAESAAASDADKKLQVAIAADNAATTARWRALVSGAKADQMAADSASKIQDAAGAAVPESKRQARIDAAQKAVDDAQAAILVVGAGAGGFAGRVQQSATAAISTAESRAAHLQAAQETLSKAQGGGGNAKGGGGGGAPSGSFLSKAIVGPVKIWHTLVGGAVAVGGVLLYRWKKK